jgi:hypothetical protein
MNALVSAGLVFGTTKAYGMANTLEIPMSVYSQAAAIMGASKIVADNGSNDPVTRAILSGALYSGISFVVFKEFLPKKIFPDVSTTSKNRVVDSLLLEAIAKDGSIKERDTLSNKIIDYN